MSFSKLSPTKPICIAFLQLQSQSEQAHLKLESFFGINILVSNVNLPRIHKYWQPATRIDRIASAMLVNRFFEINCTIDEQMIPFTGHMPAKQVMKSKSNPVGIKNWVICGKSGRALDFELYQGAGAGTIIPQECKHLGLGAAVIMRLSQMIPLHKSYKLCFDNYFTGLSLLRELKQKGILSLGTLRGNRLMSGMYAEK